MGQESPHKDKYPLYRGDEDDRSNLEIVHDKHLAQAVTFSQIALSILVLGATIAAFLYLILENVDLVILGYKIAEIRAYICLLVVFPLFLISAAKRFFLSWSHHLTAQFIEEVLGAPQTSNKHKLHDKLTQFKKYDIDEEKLKQFIKYDTDDEKLKQFGKRRYCLFLDKILKHIPF